MDPKVYQIESDFDTNYHTDQFYLDDDHEDTDSFYEYETYHDEENDYDFDTNDEQNFNADLDIDTIKNEFQNSNTDTLISNSLQFNKLYLSTLNQHQQFQNQRQHQNQSEPTIKINEDDLIDRHDFLRQIFLKDFFEKYDCVCDQTQGLFATKHSKLSKSLQRKLITLHQLLMPGSISNELSSSNPSDIANLVANQDSNKIIKNSIQNNEYKKKLFRLMRALAERVLIDALSLCDQYNNQIQQKEMMLSNQQNTSLNTSTCTVSSSNTTSTSSNTNLNNPTSKLWCEIRNRGCQFLGPQMQDDVLRLILHALETVNRMSRKVLVLYVVHMLKKHYPKASKTSVGHVVQLLYRAGCFKVEKRDNDSSLMELRKEFCKYPALRRQHDTQIIQIALESGIRMSPEQWSQKLFGDSMHKSEMQSIIDKLQSQQTLEKLINDFYEKLTSAPCSPLSHPNEAAINSIFLQIKSDFEFFASINFEKKQPVQTNDPLRPKRNSIASVSSSSANTLNNLGSGGESLTSEDDEICYETTSEMFANEESQNEFTDSDFDHKSNEAKLLAQQQKEQTKIVWSLLIECLKRSLNILTSHLDYTSKMMSIILQNQLNNSNNQLMAQNKLTTNKLSNSNLLNTQNKISSNLQSLNKPFGTQSIYDSININFVNQVPGNQAYLMPMGPNSNNAKLMQHGMSKPVNRTNKPGFVPKQYNMSRNVNMISNAGSETDTYLGQNQFGLNRSHFSNDLNFSTNNPSHKLWCDIKNRSDKQSEFANGSGYLDQTNRYQQNNLFDSNSFMASIQDQQFYTNNRSSNQFMVQSNLVQQQQAQNQTKFK